ncbi:MAG: methyltransferase [Clostridiales bacterium]|nr:methyltransferase [Candidatus Crickella merdequi]
MIKDGERLDSTGFGAIKVIQHKGLGYGVDAVLLAAFAAGETGAKGVSPSARVGDLGTGSGIVSFVMAHKREDITADGFELREDACDRAKRACLVNGLEERVRFFNCDISEITGEDFFETYDAVVTNPPYFKKSAAIPNASYHKYTARHETTAELEDFIETAKRMLKPSGDFYMVHRPNRMVDILASMREKGIEPKELQLVVPRAGEAANILLVHGVKGAGEELKLLPDIAVHNEGSDYTEVINLIYERSV